MRRGEAISGFFTASQVRGHPATRPTFRRSGALTLVPKLSLPDYVHPPLALTRRPQAPVILIGIFPQAIQYFYRFISGDEKIIIASSEPIVVME